MKERLFIAIITLTFGIVSCENKVSSTSEQSQINETNTKSVEQMNSYISIFEIPAKDISRAINFYQEILEMHIEKLQFP